MISSRILIAADIVPTSSNVNKFIDGDADYLVGEKLLKRLNDADFIVMNLEVPLADEETPIRKCGPCLIAPTKTIKGIRAINPYFFTLANNHILDQGVLGLETTIKVLEANGISYAGVGKTVAEARKPYIKTISGLKVGIYCCAEHEFSIASDRTPGANPYDPLESFDDVRKLKKECNYVIVLYHGGIEHYRYPSPLLRKVFYKFAQAGADLVVAQHTHCIGCMEVYRESTLVYGQGNFLFDHSESEYWKTSLVICIDIADRSFELSFIPIVKKSNCVRMATGEMRKKILDEFRQRSKEIQQKGFVEEQYKIFAQQMEKEYLLRLYGKKSKSIFVRVLNKLSGYGYIKAQYPKMNKVVVRNVIECEAHNELAIAVMNLSVDGE